MKHIFYRIFLFIVCFIFSNSISFAENFYIENYNVDATVSEKRTVNITENIDVYFTKQSHGIYRTIPLANRVERQDGSSELIKAKVSDIFVLGNDYQTDFGSNTCNIKIGNPNELVAGRKKYTIKYKYQISGNKLKNKDEFYFNIIGTEWPVEIHKVNFRINMPKQFNPNNTGISVGRYGKRGFSEGEALYYTTEKEIFGRTNRILYPNEAVTLRIELPEGYFINQDTQDTLKTVYVILGIIFFTFIPFIIWFKYGKDDTVIPVVNFYPPKNLNSAELEVGLKGEASTKGIVSLVLYLASKGYIKIEDDGNYYKLYKLKEYDGKNPIEENLMYSIFKSKNIVRQKELESSLTLFDDCQDYKSKQNKMKKLIFEQDKSGIIKTLIMILCIAGILILTAYSFDDNSFSFIERLIEQNGLFLLPFPIIAAVILITSVKRNPVFFTLWSWGFGGIPLVMISTMVSFSNITPQVGFTALTCIIISTICIIHLPKRNKYGRKLLGQILGFKKFLETAEKERIKAIVAENAEYCYDIIPYAYVMGISSKWIDKITNITNRSPEWYTGQHFHTKSFDRLINSFYDIITPSSSNGRSSHFSSRGGGGFSGGGCGGGGGGSW